MAVTAFAPCVLGRVGGAKVACGHFAVVSAFIVSPFQSTFREVMVIAQASEGVWPVRFACTTYSRRPGILGFFP